MIINLHVIYENNVIFFIAWHFKLLYYICTPAELHCIACCRSLQAASMRRRVGLITLLGIVIVLASNISIEDVENVEKWTHMTEAHHVVSSAGESETHDKYSQSSKNNDRMKKHSATSREPSCSDKMGCFLLSWEPFSVCIYGTRIKEVISTINTSWYDYHPDYDAAKRNPWRQNKEST